VPLRRPSARKPSAKAIVDAQKIVAIWNARQAGGRALWFYPTIGAAIAAGLPWLSFSCPACGQVGSVDLRTLDRHPGGSISRQGQILVALRVQGFGQRSDPSEGVCI
jgi:hypothetical protein